MEPWLESHGENRIVSTKIFKGERMKASIKLIAALWLIPSLAIHGAELNLEANDGNAPVMQCIEWSEFVKSMADTGIERFLVLAREYI